MAYEQCKVAMIFEKQSGKTDRLLYYDIANLIIKIKF